MGNDSIIFDTSLSAFWRAWRKFSRGKRKTKEILNFWAGLEGELSALADDVRRGTYRHGPYYRFTVNDRKRREISVASIRDRVVHRLLYDHLVRVYDKSFDYDAWSCRKEKGLAACIVRLLSFAQRFPDAAAWRADIRKYFESMSHVVLWRELSRQPLDSVTFEFLSAVIGSFGVNKVGVPIGNITSQIFANIYLNAWDRHVRNVLKPLAYLRYGDDFVLIGRTSAETAGFRSAGAGWLRRDLKLEVQARNDTLSTVKNGIAMLGVVVYPGGIRLDSRARKRATDLTNRTNAASYEALVRRNENARRLRLHNWKSYERIIPDI